MPAMTQLAHLPGRAALAITGADRVGFLNGLVSNDVALAAPGRAIWAALLTPQGKYLADFFILAQPDRLILDCDAGQTALLTQRLSRFRLRADAAIAPAALAIHAAWDTPPDPAWDATTVAAPDPRLPQAGWRILAPAPLPTNATAADWNAHRLALGLPDAQDMEPEKTVLLEAGFDALHGISWTKGCYMGQELTARTRYRGLLKRRLMQVTAAGALPPPGTALMDGDREMGDMRSSQGGIGLALLRLEADGATLLGAGTTITARMQDWAKTPEPA